MPSRSSTLREAPPRTPSAWRSGCCRWAAPLGLPGLPGKLPPLAGGHGGRVVAGSRMLHLATAPCPAPLATSVLLPPWPPPCYTTRINSSTPSPRMQQVPGATTYFGCVGKDHYADALQKVAAKDGVNVSGSGSRHRKLLWGG